LAHHHPSSIEANPSGLSNNPINDLETQFAEQQTIVNLCCIPSGLAFLLLTHTLLVESFQFLERADGIPGYKITYQPVIWWFFPGFGALCLCFEITLQIWTLFVGRNVVDLYSEWDSRQPKKSRGGIVYYDARKVLRWFSLLIALPIGIFSGLALNMHTTFGEDGIHTFGYAFAAPVFHSYDEIRDITLVQGKYDKHGKFFERPFFVLGFADGHHWLQSDWDDTATSMERSLSAILVQKTHIPIANADTINDIQPPTSAR
jgi:hypothetical protein